MSPYLLQRGFMVYSLACLADPWPLLCGKGQGSLAAQVPLAQTNITRAVKEKLCVQPT